jgi:PAS domain S-box-containing protein
VGTKPRLMVELFAIVVAYYIASKIGLLWTLPMGAAPVVSPAAGVALAGVLVFGSRVWPAIFIGSLLSNALASDDFPSIVSALNKALPVISIGIGPSLQAICGSFLVHRFVKFPSSLSLSRDVVRLLLLAGPISCLLSATWGVTTLKWAGALAGEEYLFRWSNWWIGDTIGVIVFTPLILFLSAQPVLISWGRKMSVSLPVCFALIIVLASFVYINDREQDQVKLEFNNHAGQLARQIRENFETYNDVLYSVQNIFASALYINRQQFSTFVARWFSLRPGIRSIAWNPRVLDAERLTYEQAARQDGLSNFQITEQDPEGRVVRAGQRPEYMPSFYQQSVRGNGRSLGFDTASDRRRREALDRARDTGLPTATDTLSLISNDEPGFVVFLPVYYVGRPQNSLQERRLNLQGFVSGAFRIGDIIKSALRNQDAEGFSIRLYEYKREGMETLLYNYDSRSNGLTGQQVKREHAKSVLQQDFPLHIAGRSWVLKFAPTESYLVSRQGSQSSIILLGGMLFVGVAAAFLLVTTGNEATLQALNSKLEQEIVDHNSAEDQIARYAVIVDSLEEAIIGTTWGGIITTWNRGAEIVYGYTAEEVIGLSILTLYPPDQPDEFSSQREKLARGNNILHYETVRLRKDGSEVPVGLSVSVMRDTAGNVTGIASISQNISARKRVETELRQHREAVAYRLHDSVLQSLAAISLHLEVVRKLLTRDLQLAGQHLTKIETILSDEQQNLRFFVRELAGTAKPMNDSQMADLLEELIKRLESQWNICIEVRAERSLNWIPEHFVESLFHMIKEGVSNAVRHGHCSVVQIQIAHIGENVSLSIIDNGCGFHLGDDITDSCAKDFGPKMLTSRVLSLGGSVSVQSTYTGARVDVTLPLSQ